MANYGEYAAQLGSIAALKAEDLVYSQYRELGCWVWRGFSLQMCADQCYSNYKEGGKGKQMPVHYSSKKKHNMVCISSPLGTKIPQAAGSGYAFRLNNQDRVAVVFFGDGAASEGDFHAGMNFAATLKSQTLFLCRNNGWAISTPCNDQYAGDGIVARGPGYGMHSIRVDGNDIIAVYSATKKAREIIMEHKVPVLIEFLTYRVGAHSTSDNPDFYRDSKETEH